MVMDYSGRRPVAKNRPRKQPVGIFAVVLISAISMSFALGVLTGWFVFRPARKAAQSQSVPVAGAKAPDGAPQGNYPNPEASAGKAGEPPLTFYETLPKGGKAIIGSGLNPKKEGGQPAKPAPVAPPAPQPQQPAQAPAKPESAAEEGKEQGPAAADQAKKGASGDAAPVPKPAASGKFCVQVASTQDRKEAEALKAKLAGKGLSAYIVESNIKEKGTWFRIRVGKHLPQQAAGDLAAKAGKGAMIIPE